MVKAVFGEQNAYLFREDTHTRLYELLGAHLADAGCYFSVWAPNAASVGIMGEFNDWRSESASLELNETTGIWHEFVPGVALGSLYKYHVHSKLNDLWKVQNIYFHCLKETRCQADRSDERCAAFDELGDRLSMRLPDLEPTDASKTRG